MPVSDIYGPDISAHFARVVTQRAGERGMDVAELLRSSGLSAQIVAQPQARISAQQLGALMRKVWAGLDDELSGFGAAPQRFGCFALMARQMVHCQTLAEALRYSFRFTELTSRAMRWSMPPDAPGELCFELFDTTLDPDHFLEEFMPLIWHRFANWLVGERIPLIETRFRFEPPAHAAEYALMFPGPVSYRYPLTSLRLEPESLELPVVRDREELRHYLQRLPDEWFIKQVFEDSLSERVLSAVWEAGFSLSLERLARNWHMSKRTLHRQLQREGTSYRQLRDQARRERATALLVGSNCQVRKVAQELKMSEPAFSRAFKHWTGLTPIAYRNMRLPPGGR